MHRQRSTRPSPRPPAPARGLAALLSSLALCLWFGGAALAQSAPQPSQAPTEPAEPAQATASQAPPPPGPAELAAAERAEDPRGLIELRYRQIQAIVAETADAATMRQRIQELTQGFVDFDEFARLTIKRAWPTLSEKQRATFVTWFRRLIQATYAAHFEPRQKIDMVFRGSTDFRGQRAQVKTTLRFDDSAVDVDYRFHRVAPQDPTGDGQPVWRVYDLVIDEVSLMRNYRGQFRRILKRDGFDALIAKIQEAVKRKTAGDKGNEI